MTVWENLKEDWVITKSDIEKLGINAKKKWEDVTVVELGIIADYLDVNVSDLFT